MVGIAQLVRAPDCGSGGRGFKSRCPPLFYPARSIGVLVPRKHKKTAPSRRLKPAKPTRTLRSRPSAAPKTPRPGAFPIVGVGASAGGMEAFVKLMEKVPAASGLAFVFVQHLDPTHRSLLPELLNRASKVPVSQAHDGQEILPDHVYVIPPDS